MKVEFWTFGFGLSLMICQGKLSQKLGSEFSWQSF